MLPHLLMCLDSTLLPSQALPTAPQTHVGRFCTGAAGCVSHLAGLPAALAPAGLPSPVCEARAVPLLHVGAEHTRVTRKGGEGRLQNEAAGDD